MKVILLKKVNKLGEEGAVRDVAEGYARNFLIPKNLAKPATPELIAKAEKQKKTIVKKAERELKDMQKLASALDGQEIELAEKASASGKLYAAVSTAKIVKNLNKLANDDLDKKWVKSGAIKTLGEHEVVLALPHGLEARVKLVVREE